MLTNNLVRVRFDRQRIVPCWVDVGDPDALELAGRMIEVFRGGKDKSRGETEAEVAELTGDDPDLWFPQGLAKLCEDRCTFEVVSGLEPEAVREAVFLAAAGKRTNGEDPFDRSELMANVATTLGVAVEQVEQSLFADLKSEQRLMGFDDLSPERILLRYNVALAQGVLLKAVHVKIDIRNEPPARMRQLFRWIKFHRLVCEVSAGKPDGYCLRLDGPLSLFAATQKYGVQLASFLPAVLQCREFVLEADVRWGTQRREKQFVLTHEAGLIAENRADGSYVPPELAMFVEQFAKKVSDWQLHDESEVLKLGNRFWVPDFRLEHLATKKSVYLEILGFWRKSSALEHLERMQSAKVPYLVAVSDSLRVDEQTEEEIPGLIRFRQMPLPSEVAKQASIVLGLSQ